MFDKIKLVELYESLFWLKTWNFLIKDTLFTWSLWGKLNCLTNWNLAFGLIASVLTYYRLQEESKLISWISHFYFISFSAFISTCTLLFFFYPLISLSIYFDAYYYFSFSFLIFPLKHFWYELHVSTIKWSGYLHSSDNALVHSLDYKLSTKVFPYWPSLVCQYIEWHSTFPTIFLTSFVLKISHSLVAYFKTNAVACLHKAIYNQQKLWLKAIFNVHQFK